ncbi:hypothetical protein EBR96_00445, partial [bacterium]|nr:hypothetical protein [bacterium]
MPLYVCVRCHQTTDFPTHPEGAARCETCRERLMYFGAESVRLSREAQAASGHLDRFPAETGLPGVPVTVSAVPADSSILEAETQLRYTPDAVPPLLHLAIAYQTRRDWRRSIWYWEKLVRIAPDVVSYQEQLAENYLLAGLIKESIPVLATILAAHPHHAVAHYNMAFACGKVGR